MGTLEKINRSESLIRKSPKNYNELVKLLTLLKQSMARIDDEKARKVIEALIISLTKSFTFLLKKGQLRSSSRADERSQMVAKWLQSKYRQYIEVILGSWTLKSDEDYVIEIQMDALASVMSLVKVESDYTAKSQRFFATKTYGKVVGALMVSGSADKIRSGDYEIDNPLLLEFYRQYFAAKWDLKYYLFETLADHMDEIHTSSSDKDLILANLLTLVKLAPMYPKKEVDEYMHDQLAVGVPGKVSDLKQFRASFERTWINVMSRFELDKQQYKSIISVLSKRIIPFLNNPTKLMDFLTDSYNLGFDQKDVELSILSLNGLWELMRSYNLEYPDFYEKLYGLLTPDLLHSKYRSRFLRLMDLFLSSTHLSATIVASFIKRLSRLSLTAPAPGVVAVIPFIYNLLKRHPTCMLLIHNPYSGDDYKDKYDDSEVDPVKTNAMESSLWELESVMKHWHPQVASLAKILSQPFTKFSYNMEDFLDWSYSRLFESEVHKRVKGEIDLEYETWDTMYGEGGYMDGYTV